MGAKGQRKCCNCKEFFIPDARNATRQRYCSKPECRAASKKAAQQQWCNKNPSYFRGPINVKRVREWRGKNPGYWKKNLDSGVLQHSDALQDTLNPQTPAIQDVILDSVEVSEECLAPLQDILQAQNTFLVGLTALLCGEALQDTIETILLSCYESGQRIGGVVPWMTNKEKKHEKTRTNRAEAMSPCAVAVQLGGSASGP
jgi:hypothetical protein